MGRVLNKFHCKGCASSTYLLKMNAKIKSKRALRCSQCKFKTMSGYYLNRHVRVFHEKKEAMARKASSVTKTNVKHHVKNEVKVTNRTTFPCPYCDIKALRKSALELHIKAVHYNVRQFSCNLCDFQTAYRANLRDHSKSIHDKINDVICEECGYSTYRKESLKRHVRMVHKKIRDKKCSQCNYTTSLSHTLKKHIEGVHEKKKDNCCKSCDFKTASLARLKNHVKSKHEKLNDITCQHCPYKTYSKYVLRRHMRAKHLKMKDIKCDQCDYSTSLGQNLKNHIVVAHSANFAFSCNKCTYQTNFKAVFRHHQRAVHLKIKDLNCEHCNFSTAYPARLKKHSIKCATVKKEVIQDVKYKECFVQLTPLRLFGTSPPPPPPPPSPIETTNGEGSCVKGDITEAVVRSLKETLFKDVKKMIGEAVALHLFDQWWAKEEEKHKVNQEKLISNQIKKESERDCDLCEYQAEGEGNLTEHLMADHVFDLE